MILQKIETLCEQKGISIAKLESDCGIGNGTIGRWDKSSPTVKNIQKIATYFGVGIETLLEGCEKRGGEQK